MVFLYSKEKYSVIQFLYGLTIQDIQGKYGENKEGKFEKWKMNREIGMGMYEYRWIWGYEDIFIDRKGLILE